MEANNSVRIGKVKMGKAECTSVEISPGCERIQAIIKAADEMEKLPNGTVKEFMGIDLVKQDQHIIPLNDLLCWEGLQKALEENPMPDLEVSHTFSGGVYIRQMMIPAGIFIIGKRHRHETCNILLSGCLSVYLGDGKPVQKVRGPMIMTSDPMIRKIAYCHEDAVFLNIHPTTENDLEKIEAEFIITEPEFKLIKGGSK